VLAKPDITFRPDPFRLPFPKPDPFRLPPPSARRRSKAGSSARQPSDASSISRGIGRGPAAEWRSDQCKVAEPAWIYVRTGEASPDDHRWSRASRFDPVDLSHATPALALDPNGSLGRGHIEIRDNAIRWRCANPLPAQPLQDPVSSAPDFACPNSQFVWAAALAFHASDRPLGQGGRAADGRLLHGQIACPAIEGRKATLRQFPT
jgi:hypothetical protein